MDREQDREIRRRFGDLHAADRVEEHVLVETPDPRMPMQHRKQHREPILLEAYRKAPRIGHLRGIDERLDLDEQGPRAFLRDQHTGARDLLFMLRQKQCRRIRDAAQAFVRHREYAKLVDRAEAILDRAHEPV